MRTPRSFRICTFACVAAFAHIWRFIAGASVMRARRRKTKRREQIVREAVRETRDELGSRRRDDDLVGPARELDVTHRRFGRLVPEVGAHRASGDGLERQRSHELLRAARHDDLHFGAVLHEPAHEVRALVGGDAAGDAEQDLAGLRTHGADYGGGLRAHQTRRCIEVFRKLHGGRWPRRAQSRPDARPHTARGQADVDTAMAAARAAAGKAARARAERPHRGRAARDPAAHGRARAQRPRCGPRSCWSNSAPCEDC